MRKYNSNTSVFVWLLPILFNSFKDYDESEKYNEKSVNIRIPIYLLAIFFLNANTESFSFMIDRRNIYTRMLITLHYWLYCIDIAAIISSFLLHDPKYCVMHSPFNFSY